MNCASKTNYQGLNAVISLVNAYSVLVSSVNFHPVIGYSQITNGCFSDSV